MKTFRRPLLDPIRNKSGYVAQAQQMQRDIRDLQRAPVRIPATQVVVPKKKPAAMVTPAAQLFDLYLMACDAANEAHQYFLKLSAGVWSVADHSVDLLPSADFPGDTPSGGMAFGGTSMWVSAADNIVDAAWRSTDAGLTWTRELVGTTSEWPRATPVAESLDTTLWAVLRNAGGVFEILKSVDNGDNWTVSETGAADDNFYHVAVHPTDANIIAVAGWTVSGGNSKAAVWVTTDGGSNWTQTILDRTEEPFSESTCLVFTDVGDLLYATLVFVAGPSTDHLSMYKASSPYTSFARTDLLTATPDILFDGPFMAASRNPQFVGVNWDGNPPDASIHGRVFRSTGGSWTELAEPFAGGNVLWGLLYSPTTKYLYALGADVSAGTGPGELYLARAANADVGSVTWEDITADVNAAAGVTLAVLGASALFEVAA